MVFGIWHMYLSYPESDYGVGCYWNDGDVDGKNGPGAAGTGWLIII